jgi:hypothetical protein
MATTAYSPELVVVTVDGILLDGFASDSHLTIEYSGPETSWTQGSHGSSAVHIHNNHLGKVTMSILHGGKSHAYLLGMMKTSRLTSLVVHDVAITDLMGTLQFSGSMSITVPAKYDYAEEAANHAWEFEGVINFLNDSGGIAQ